MQLTVLKCKIHRATVTGSELAYEGSVTIDPDLCYAAGLLAYEQVDVYNCTNGSRFTTYVIYGESGSGVVCVNGAAARLTQPGDSVILAAYGQLSEEEAANWQPKKVFVDAENRITEVSS